MDWCRFGWFLKFTSLMLARGALVVNIKSVYWILCKSKWFSANEVCFQLTWWKFQNIKMYFGLFFEFSNIIFFHCIQRNSACVFISERYRPECIVLPAFGRAESKSILLISDTIVEAQPIVIFQVILWVLFRRFFSFSSFPHSLHNNVCVFRPFSALFFGRLMPICLRDH